MTVAYSSSFYSEQEQGSITSARAILPFVWDRVTPASVIDVGCGVGAWLAVASELGASEILGVEGPWVRDGGIELAIDESKLAVRDLSVSLSIDSRFDLALCLEVAEHLDAERAESFVADLVKLAPAIFFSAAIPGQSGTNHVNCQWQSYWAKLFAGHGFRAVDLRPRYWYNGAIPFWYRQNSLLYLLGPEPDGASSDPLLDVVHPDRYQALLPFERIMRPLAALVPSSVRRLARRVL